MSLKEEMKQSIKETDELLRKKTKLYYALCELYKSLVKLNEKAMSISFRRK